MVLLPKKRGQIGGQGIDELLPLEAIMRFKPAKIVPKALIPRFAQAPRQAAVNHRMFAVMQADASTLINQRLNAIEVRVGPDKFMPGHPGAFV